MKPWLKSLLLLACVCAYLSLGALTFIELENRHSVPVGPRLSQSMSNFVTDNNHCGVTDERLRSFLEEVVEKAVETGVFRTNAHPVTGIEEVWTHSNAFIFAFEVVTTIGQGELVPRTFEGRLFCIFFAFLGVPLCYLMLCVVGDTCYFMWKKLGKLFSRIHRRSIRVALGVTFTVIVLSMFLVNIPALIVSFKETWDYFSSQYYIFMILSTVGLGDLSRSLKRTSTVMSDWAWKIGCVLYNLICLSVISVVFKAINEYRKNVRDEKNDKRVQKMVERNTRKEGIPGSVPDGNGNDR